MGLAIKAARVGIAAEFGLSQRDRYNPLSNPALDRPNDLVGRLEKGRMSRILGFVGLTVLIILLGIGAAKLVDQDDLTRQIAVFAAVVACGSVVVNALKAIYDVLDKERDRQKKTEDKKEKVRVTVCCKPQNRVAPTIGVELYNEGNSVVAIKQVRLCLKTDSGELVGQLTTVMSEREVKPFATMGPRCSDDDRTRLEPKAYVEFVHVPIEPRLQLEKLLTYSPEDLSLITESFTGELAVIPGQKIQSVIREMKHRLAARQLT